MKAVVFLITSVVALGVSVWFDFSTPVVSYIYGLAMGKEGMGISFGWKIKDIPAMEFAYLKFGDEHFLALKPFIISADVKKLRTNGLDLMVVGKVSPGIDTLISPEGFAVNISLGTGGGIRYDTEDGKMFFEGVIEVDLRFQIFGKEGDFSPYYLKLFGPLHVKPSLTIGGKF